MLALALDEKTEEMVNYACIARVNQTVVGERKPGSATELFEKSRSLDHNLNDSIRQLDNAKHAAIASPHHKCDLFGLAHWDWVAAVILCTLLMALLGAVMMHTWDWFI